MRKGSNKITLPNGKKITQFEYHWGISARELAEQDGVSPEAVHMRIKKWGTPFQRKAKPGLWEKQYFKTIWELSDEMDLHPITICQRYHNNGDIYKTKTGKSHPSAGTGNKSQWTNPPVYKKLPWLHPSHPDYGEWRSGRLDMSQYDD